MARKQRVSVQGRGADLFFEGVQPEPLEDTRTTTTAEEPEADVTPIPEKREAQDQQGSTLQQESSQASMLASDSPENDLISSAILDAVWRDVAEQATVTNAFRYTHEELAQLSDAIYELGKQHGTRVTKQEVARLGLNAILTDYQIRGNQSLLSEFIARRADVGR